MLRSFGYAATSQLETNLDVDAIWASLAGTDSGSDFEIKSIVEAMCSLQNHDMSYSEFEEMEPMAQELLHYLEECLQSHSYTKGNITAD